jgi:hypothetical protein
MSGCPFFNQHQFFPFFLSLFLLTIYPDEALSPICCARRASSGYAQNRHHRLISPAQLCSHPEQTLTPLLFPWEAGQV